MSEDIDMAIDLLKVSESSDDHEKILISFIDGITILDELLKESHPESKKIKNLKLSYTRSLLSKLAANREDIENEDIWNLYCKIFLILVKDETFAIISSNPNLKEYLIEFIGLYADKASHEVANIIDKLSCF